MYAFAHPSSHDENFKQSGFFSGVKGLAFVRGFYGLKGLVKFLSHNKYLCFSNI